ncbi:MAG: dihydroorotase family protein [Spirochaetales bacterium]|nr:dihydroorotase family protein [Spirochaetales bacterium]
MIDPHVHLRDWNLSAKETLAHGLLVAEKSGFAAVIDMPNTDPPLTTRTRIIERIDAAKRVKVNVSYHLWAGVTSDPAQIDEIVQSCEELFPAVVGLKLFAGHSTGNMGLVEEEIQARVYRHLAERNYTGAVALHCEKETLLRPELYDNADLSTQSLARPQEAEIASIRDQLSLSKEAGFAGHLHIAHLSTIEGLLIVEEARREGRRISCGATPHHLLLNRDTAKDRSLYAKMNPPLRNEETRRKLFEALLEGRIDWVESDHAPHTIADKEAGASGIPGFSGMLSLLKVLYEHNLSNEVLKDLFGGNVQRMLNLPPQKTVLPRYETLPALIAEASKEYPYDSFRGLSRS